MLQKDDDSKKELGHDCALRFAHVFEKINISNEFDALSNGEISHDNIRYQRILFLKLFRCHCHHSTNPFLKY